MTPPLSVDTLTDEQIRAWESETLHSGATHAKKRSAVDLATRALARIPSMKELLVLDPGRDPRPKITAIKRMRTRARARCADLLNAARDASQCMAYAASKCIARAHRAHATVTCNGACCTACGGPIDENEECRC